MWVLNTKNPIFSWRLFIILLYDTTARGLTTHLYLTPLTHQKWVLKPECAGAYSFLLLLQITLPIKKMKKNPYLFRMHFSTPSRGRKLIALTVNCQNHYPHEKWCTLTFLRQQVPSLRLQASDWTPSDCGKQLVRHHLLNCLSCSCLSSKLTSTASSAFKTLPLGSEQHFLAPSSGTLKNAWTEKKATHQQLRSQ